MPSNVDLYPSVSKIYIFCILLVCAGTMRTTWPSVFTASND